ncbi:MAG: HD domain-containing protein [Dehalococcoidia bacterium]|nr:HD domain-containing protein [Dehalococcoidia bacterium]
MADAETGTGRGPARMTGAAAHELEVRVAFARHVGRLLAGLGYGNTYLVGGYVRALTMSTSTNDFDIAIVGGDAISAARETADALEADFYVLDAERGRGCVVGRGWRDISGLERFTIDMTPADGDSIEVDLSRRDFSIDAMALPLTSAGDVGAIIDPYGGRQDLERRSVRALNDRVFQVDPVRLLRAVRLAWQLGFTIETHTASLVESTARMIRIASPERQRDEVCRMLALDRTAEAFTQTDELGLLSQVFPELDEARGVEQPREHYWDVFHHLLETVRAFDGMIDSPRRETDPAGSSLPWPEQVSDYFAEDLTIGRSRSVATKLACLLHDVAKPKAKTFEPSGRIRFFGHGEQGAEIASSVMERLRFSRRETQFVSSSITHHLRPVQLSQDLAAPSKRAVYRYRDALGEAGIATLYLSMADYLAAKGPMLELPKWRERTDYCSIVLTELLDNGGTLDQPSPAIVDGHLLMDELDLRPGRELGRILTAVKEAVAVGEAETRTEALAIARNLMETGPKTTPSRHDRRDK